MKRTLLALMLLATSVRGLGDGTFSAKNLGGDPILGFEFRPLSRWLGRVEILDGNAVLASGSLVKDGFFALGIVYDPNPGAAANLTIRVWDADVGATFAQALLVADRVGYGVATVELRNVPLAKGATVPTDLVSAGFRQVGLYSLGCIICPEPKSVTLACAGLGGLLLLGRRFSGS